MLSFPLDVAGPGAVAFLGGTLVVGVVLFVLVVVVEAVVLTVMKWGRFRRSLLASFLMNVVSTIAGVFVVGIALTVGGPAWLLLTFVASVVLEGGVVVVMDRAQARRGLAACVIANVVSYLPVGCLLILTGTLP